MFMGSSGKEVPGKGRRLRGYIGKACRQRRKQQEYRHGGRKTVPYVQNTGEDSI